MDEFECVAVNIFESMMLSDIRLVLFFSSSCMRHVSDGNMDEFRMPISEIIQSDLQYSLLIQFPPKTNTTWIIHLDTHCGKLSLDLLKRNWDFYCHRNQNQCMLWGHTVRCIRQTVYTYCVTQWPRETSVVCWYIYGKRVAWCECTWKVECKWKKPKFIYVHNAHSRIYFDTVASLDFHLKLAS